MEQGESESQAVHDFTVLAQAEALWRHWGFEPWSHAGLEGLRRRVTFSKGGLLGEVARYYALDFIIWRHDGREACRRIVTSWGPEPDVMLQRFVFVVDDGAQLWRRRAFWFGFKGYLEVWACAPGAKAPRKLRDLAPLISEAWRRAQGGATSTTAAETAEGGR